MKAFYLLALIIILAGCGELVNPERETSTSYDINRSDNDKFVPIFGVEKKHGTKKYPVLNVLNNRIIESIQNPHLVQGINKRSVLYQSDLPVSMINLDIGFYYVGRYVEDGCTTKMYKKEYEISWLYIHVDCKGNRSKYHKDK